jgi:hypothetical protein
LTIITFRYLNMDEVAQFALKTLRELSPVGSGEDPHPGLYRDSHTLFLNGHDVPDAKAWKPGDQLEISNPEPYARKIEVGAMKVNVDGHVYERSAQIVRRQYGSVVKVEFLFMPLRFGNAQAQASSGISARHTRRAAKRRSGDWLVRQPAIVLSAG